jgi:hypothetical protein
MSKRTYDSAYGATRKITAAARLAEIACTRLAMKARQSLRLRFWLEPEWERTFLMQQRFANNLLKIYDAQAVFKAFEANDWIVSLGYQGLVKLIDAEQVKVDALVRRVDDPQPPAPNTPAAEVVRSPSMTNKQTLRSKLKDL